MVEELWINSLLHFGIIVESIILAVLISSRKNAINFFHVAFFITLIVTQAAELIYSIVWIREQIPFAKELLHVDFGLQYLFGPFLWLANRENLNWKSLIHFLPATIVLLFTPWAVSFDLAFRIYFFLGAQIHLIIYGIFALLSNTLSAHRVLILGFVATRALRVFEFVLWQVFGLIELKIAWSIYLIAESLFVFALARLLINQSLWKAKVSTNQQSNLPNSVFLVLNDQLMSYLAQKDVFSDPLISVKKVADHFRVAPHHVSRFMNVHLDRSFLDTINTNRLSFCEEKLKDPMSQHYSIQEVYFDAGFNSKSVFNTAFKKRTGLTPSQYRSKHLTVVSIAGQ